MKYVPFHLGGPSRTDTLFNQWTLDADDFATCLKARHAKWFLGGVTFRDPQYDPHPPKRSKSVTLQETIVYEKTDETTRVKIAHITGLSYMAFGATGNDEADLTPFDVYALAARRRVGGKVLLVRQFFPADVWEEISGDMPGLHRWLDHKFAAGATAA